MATESDDRNLALFCDFENVALGVRDAKFAKFDIQLVLQRLLVKGSIVYKKAYSDWDRYKEFKPDLHNASFELIEIPHTRQSGKNSADIRLVVDALDLCYTKEHIDTFVIISGDSDFSPLVSKLRENAKTVIGLGVKNSTSDLLINNCDEFIYYDDLVRDDTSTRKRRQNKPKAAARKKAKKAGNTEAESAESNEEDRLEEAMSLLLTIAEDLYAERGDSQKLWGSMIKQTMKRRRPGFNEKFYGFRAFGDLLEEAESRGLLELEMDDRSGQYFIKRLNTDG